MATAPDARRWTYAPELRADVPARCEQVEPRARCASAVDRVCDLCDKGICFQHAYLSHQPRAVDVAAGHARRPFSAPHVELCLTCRELELELGRAAEEVSAADRRAWLGGDEASGYIGVRELRALGRWRG